ncbi:MAG: outer membrane protein assembly factor BamD [Gammaproteobacteria bacterium]|nr:outer membrane protein assembly factor BamD [Gammaproteobacteria bacterium]
MRLYSLLLTTIILLTASGCSGLTKHKDETAGWSASEFYNTGKAALERADYMTALELYKKMETRHPYGRYTQQAQLETAFAHYKLSEPEPAIAAADRFIKLYPRHPQVDYAYYIRALASFDIGDSFMERLFAIDDAEKNPDQTRESFRNFKELVNRFPKSKYVEDSIKHMTHLRNQLARYEIHVADYYLRRKAYLSAANRAKYVVENYSKTPSIPQALAIMARTYAAMDMPKLANDALKLLKLNYPGHTALNKAMEALPKD